jgi:hypothetical protein
VRGKKITIIEGLASADGKLSPAEMGAILNAIVAAVGDEVFRRSPVTSDIILTSLEAGRRVHEPLTTHI